MLELTKGQEMYDLMERLFPICRSITGNGVRESFEIIKDYIPIQLFEVPTGTKVFDWVVPKEWNIKDAYIMDETGRKIVDFKEHNLHIVGYSTSIDEVMSLDELQKHLYSLEHQPNAIPYITSYYKERWGFCITHREREKLKDGNYQVYIDSELKDGHLTYGELIIPGETDKEIFLSTYLRHPSMANNELSGPVLAVYLSKWLMEQDRKYTYRIVFIPETIGSITYLSRNLVEMKRKVIAGFNITCVGDEQAYSYLPSRQGDTLADRVAQNILQSNHPDFVSYSFLDRGSDERQYCSPGVDLPVASVMRTKYGQFPEYHTSLDNLDFVTAKGLQGSFDVYKSCIELIEWNAYYQVKCLGEPQLGKRGLYPTLSTKESGRMVRDMMNLIAYSDGKHDLIDISNIIGVPVEKLYPTIQLLMDHDLLTAKDVTI
jgi:aminopeptidase-like protein